MVMLLIKILMFVLAPLTLGAISEQPHHITAFINPAGSVDSLWSYSYYSTNSFWNRNGKVRPAYSHFNCCSYQLYAEYAVTDCNSIELNAAYSAVKETLNGNSRGFEEIELGWKHLFRGDESSALTGEVLALIPPGEKKSSIRYGRAGGQISLLYSRMFCLFERGGWVDTGLGYRLYQGFPSDQIRAYTALGYCLFPRFQVIASGRLEYGIFNGQSRRNLNNIVFHPNYRLLNLQIECLFHVFKHASLSLGGFKHVWGNNIGRGGGFFGGAWLDF